MLGGVWNDLVGKLQDRVMDYCLRSCIIYNVAWEDPRIDQHLLHWIACGIKVDRPHHRPSAFDQLRCGIQREFKTFSFELVS